MDVLYIGKTPRGRLRPLTTTRGYGKRTHYWNGDSNSFNVALLTTIVALVLYVLAAYPLAFYRFRGRGLLFLGILATMPPMLIFIFLQQYFVRGISMSGLKG